MKKFIFLLILVTQLACKQNNPFTYSLVIENVGLFDGHENLGIVNIAIQGDSIANISIEKIEGDSIIDGSDKFIIPGLVNGHVHTWKPEDLKESYDSGILTMVNLHQVNESIDNELKQYRDSIGYARLYSAGIAATVPGGHPTQYGNIETINDTTSIKQFVKNRIENGADLIKIIRDSSAYPPNFKISPTLSYLQIKNVIDEAHRNNKKAVVHIQNLKDLINISKLKPDGFVHMWFFKADLLVNDVNIIKNAKTFIMPTALTQKRTIEFAKKDTTGIKEWALNSFTSMETMKKEISKLYQANIPILSGTDSPNLGINYGDDLINELLILKDAGLPNIAVLETATGNAAKYLDIEGNGQIDIGSKANFLILNSNPIDNLEALRNIHSIWKNGKTK